MPEGKIAHTPGPWEAVEHTAESYPFPCEMFARVVKQGGHTKEDTICEINAQGNGKYDPEVTAANALVLAAAPEMYEALRAIIDSLPKKRDWLDPVTEAIAREALARAEGRS